MMPSRLPPQVQTVITGVEYLRLLFLKHGVLPHRAIADFRFFRQRIGCAKLDFFTGSMWDRSIPVGDRLQFLCHNDRVALEYRINPRQAQQVLRHKAKTNEILVDADIVTSKVLAVFSAEGGGTTRHRHISTRAEFERFLAEGHPDGIVCKPVFGMSGDGVSVFSATDSAGAVHMDGSIWSAERLWLKMSKPGIWASRTDYSPAWQIERRTPPHPQLLALHGGTLGCVRVVTFRFDDGRIGMLTPTWKIPFGTAGIDNLDFGAFTAPVELDSGTVGTSLLQSDMTRHDHHPDTGAKLTGTVLPYWSEVLELARNAMAPFPELKSLGFDIGITDTGPSIVEVNPFWGAQMMQAPQSRGLIGGDFLAFLEEVGAEDVIRREARELPEEFK